jgi:hypothetical protein
LKTVTLINRCKPTSKFVHFKSSFFINIENHYNHIKMFCDKNLLNCSNRPKSFWSFSGKLWTLEKLWRCTSIRQKTAKWATLLGILVLKLSMLVLKLSTFVFIFRSFVFYLLNTEPVSYSLQKVHVFLRVFVIKKILVNFQWFLPSLILTALS